MIRFAETGDTTQLRSMWKVCFGDTDEYIDFFFTNKFEPDNTLLYVDDGKLMACLQMLPYIISFYGQIIPFYYLAGLCTLPECRGKGYMGKLIDESFAVMAQRGISLSILVPAEEWLFSYYAKFGFETVFDKGGEPIYLKSILDKYPDNVDTAFIEFDKTCQQGDFCVLKDSEDFKLIVHENRADNYAPKYNLKAMASVIDPKFLLGLYAARNRSKHFVINITDGLYAGKYLIKDGAASSVKEQASDLSVNATLLCRLLFGYKLSDLPYDYGVYFEEHHPVINMMLE